MSNSTRTPVRPPRGFATFTSVYSGAKIMQRVDTIKRITRDDRPAYPQYKGITDDRRGGALLWTTLHPTDHNPGFIAVREDVAEVARRIEAAQ